MSLLERLEQLYAIGGGPGANRLGGSAQEDEAHELVAGWMREAGLEVERDEAGNLYGRLRGRWSELPEVWTGSHLDTVPAGGRFDGALGVVGGLEAVQRAGQQERTLTVVAFRDEEGWSGPGCVGSRALCDVWLEPRPAAFLELHIEQGPRLEEAGASLGWSRGSQPRRRRGRLRGPGRARGDNADGGPLGCSGGGCGIVLGLRDAAAAVDGAVATVGRVEVEPGASNVIPAWARVSVDVRAPNLRRVEEVLAAVRAELSRTAEVEMAPETTQALREQLEALGVPVIELAWARVTTRASWPPRVCPPGCSSSAA